MEYDVDGDADKYHAEPINRFRSCWYIRHLVHSFWRVTETTKSVHTFMKTPGAFSYTQTVADLTPQMLSDVMIKAEQKQGSRTIQGVLADDDVPKQVKTALNSLQQSTANLLGSDGHRKLLQREGVAYTLRFGPPVVFVTPNLADT